MAFAVRQTIFCLNLTKIHYLGTKTIMTASNRMQKAMEELETNPYYEKYANKIAKLQKTSPEEFLKRVEQTAREEIIKKENAKIKERQFSSILNPKPALELSGSGSVVKKLEDVMKLDLIRDKDASEIKSIWEQYHATKDVISAIIPAEVYTPMLDRIKNYPIFLFPLPRSQGYEFIMCQFSGNVVHFTPLLCYQVHKENAPECLSIIHYTEFQDEKNIILMRGEFDKNVIDAKEAQCLANQLQLYYGQNNEEKLALLEKFTKTPDEFKHMDLIAQLETLPLQ